MTKPSMKPQLDGYPQEERGTVWLPGFGAVTGGQAIMLVTALCALAWAIARAASQSITIDEANTYIGFVYSHYPLQWWVGTNNHLLNSLLMRLVTSVFGTSQLTVRVPALIGAGIYIAACYRLCALVSRSLAVQWSLFVCLVYNPFVFDYFVAARGYSLGLGFLMTAILYSVAWHANSGTPSRRPLEVACGVSSACIALSFVSNFSLAFVDLVTIVAVFLCACQARDSKGVVAKRLARYARLLAACAVPGLIVTLFLSASVLLGWFRAWPKGELVFGANSIGETFSSIVEAMLYQLNPELVNPLLLKFLKPGQPYLLPILGTASGLWFLFLLFRRRRALVDPHSKWLWAFSLVLAGILIVTMSIHWIGYRAFHFLLPKARTGIFIAPLSILAVGALVAIPPPSRASAVIRRCAIASLLLLACHSLLCLRLNYFKEWEWDADVHDVYGIVACLNQTHGIRSVVSHWRYEASLNFYLLSSRRETIPVLKHRSDEPYPQDAQVYVLDSELDQKVLEERGLKIVYRGKSTDVVVAVSPEMAQTLVSSPCLLRTTI
jgi:hypothetical protein